MSVSPDTKTQTEVLGYQNEVKKCGLILHLKFLIKLKKQN